MSNSLDPDQAQKNVGPDLGTNYLQKLISADNTRKQRVNAIFYILTKNISTEHRCPYQLYYFEIWTLLQVYFMYKI